MSSKKIKTYTAINVQYPISTLILNGTKTIETRTYPLPDRLLNQEVLLMETPGKTGIFKARISGIIRFIACKEYVSKRDFYSETRYHCVDKNSEWAWIDGKKFGWTVEVVKIFPNPITFTGKKGIVYTNNIELQM